MSRRRTKGAVLVAAALLGVGVVAAVGGPDVAGAVSGTQSSWYAAAAHPPKGSKAAGDGAALDAAAKTLGISTGELKSELESGKTIAQVANDKGVDVNTVIDAMVAAKQADLRAHVTDLVNNGEPKHGPKGHDDKRKHHGR